MHAQQRYKQQQTLSYNDKVNLGTNASILGYYLLAPPTHYILKYTYYS